MELKLVRIAKRPTYTVGKLYVDGMYFCDTLEDAVRIIGENGDGKIKHHTAIPAGRYPVVYNYSQKLKRKLPRLQNVPFFDGILIHRGNTADDTSGCILVGENKIVGKVVNSAVWEMRICQLIALQPSGAVWITVCE